VLYERLVAFIVVLVKLERRFFKFFIGKPRGILFQLFLKWGIVEFIFYSRFVKHLCNIWQNLHCRPHFFFYLQYLFTVTGFFFIMIENILYLGIPASCSISQNAFTHTDAYLRNSTSFNSWQIHPIVWRHQKLELRFYLLAKLFRIFLSFFCQHFFELFNLLIFFKKFIAVHHLESSNFILMAALTR